VTNNLSIQQLVLVLPIQTPVDISSYTQIFIVITAKNIPSASQAAQVYFQSTNTYSYILTSFAVAGPTGPQGFTGMTGPTGPTGATGPEGNPATWWQYPAGGNVSLGCFELNDVLEINNCPSNDFNINTTQSALVNSSRDITLNANRGANVGLPSLITLNASNGNKGEIDIYANPGFAGLGGKVDITAFGGSQTIGGITYSVGGLVEINATTVVATSNTLTSAVKINAASCLSYAGATSPIGSLAGYNYVQADNAVNIVSGTVPVLPSVPGRNYIYGTNGTFIDNGLKVDSITNSSILSNLNIGSVLYPSVVNVTQIGNLTGLIEPFTSNQIGVISGMSNITSSNFDGYAGLGTMSNMSNITSSNFNGAFGTFTSNVKTVTLSNTPSNDLLITTANLSNYVNISNVNNITGLINTGAFTYNEEFFNDPGVTTFSPQPAWNGINWQVIDSLAGISTSNSQFWQTSGPQNSNYAMVLQGSASNTGAQAYFYYGLCDLLNNIDIGQQFFLYHTHGTPNSATVDAFYEIFFSANGTSNITVDRATDGSNLLFQREGPFGPYVFTGSNGYLAFTTANSSSNSGVVLWNRLEVLTNSNSTTDGMTLSNVNVIDSTSNLPLVIGAASESVNIKNWSPATQLIPSITTGGIQTGKLTGIGGKEITVVSYAIFGSQYSNSGPGSGYVSSGFSGNLCNASYATFPRNEWGAVICPESTDSGAGAAAFEAITHEFNGANSSNYEIYCRAQVNLALTSQQAVFSGKVLLFPLTLVDYLSSGPPPPP
jgi:hypothetical protein